MALLAAGVTVAVGVVLLAVTLDQQDPTAPRATERAPIGATSIVSTTTPVLHDLTVAGCAQTPTSGTWSGGIDSGPAAILAFEYAYYVQRSGTAAHQIIAPNAPDVPAAADIQRGIDAVDPGTRYCVDVHSMSEGQWSVSLTEQRPGLPPDTWAQLITTATVGGRTLIVAIAPA
ncbi:hypothetical protein [Nocardia brasiliensis]|uniref:hypothetical protein n=1 Tax=Nocardia brasiliensis TaxID=37326 RepID=UPI0018934088|nr:hypothetical protein [Nocardia brasiliensis]MBF6126588.1 hypothetical protein [Nocardia brasiliensis]